MKFNSHPAISNRRNAVGSNQYKKKSRAVKQFKGALAASILLAIFGYVYLLPIYNHVAGKLTPKVTIISPLAQSAEAAAIPTVTPTPSEHELIIQEIKTVFGKDSDKAFKLLSCENGRLNPQAKNVNTDEAHSTDWGVFQINNHWQGVTNVAFLTDYKINIRMAYNIYSRDGHSFKLWTCGRKFNI